jgi:hypothetical protein
MTRASHLSITFQDLCALAALSAFVAAVSMWADIIARLV